MSNIAYKVVRKTGRPSVPKGAFVSSIVVGENCLTYEIGKKTIPNAGGILCFKSPDRAIGYASPLEVVIEVEYENEVPLPDVCIEGGYEFGWHIPTYAISDLWEERKISEEHRYTVRQQRDGWVGTRRECVTSYWPPETIAVDSVIPLRIIRVVPSASM